MNLNNLTASFMPDNTPAPTNASKNVLGNDVDIKGSIQFSNELIFDGKIEGEIQSPGILTVGKNADVNGEIKTKSVVVYGSVTGNIIVEEKCELKASSVLTGDLKAKRIIIEEGATFVGKSEVTPNKAAAKASEPTRSSSTTSSASSAASSTVDATRAKQPASAS